MYIVAVTRWARPLEEEIADLAELMGVLPYDLRLRLAGGLPAIAGRFAQPEEARALLATLRERGHAAVACDGEKISSSDRMLTPRTFELGEDSIAVDDPARRSGSLLYSNILALVHAQLESEAHVTTTTQSRSFSAGRALITGGLVFTKKTTKEKREVENEYEQVLYLFRKSGKDSFLLRQNALRYSGLGDKIGHSSIENFSILVNALKERAPEAFYDNSLLTRRRRSTIDQVSTGQSVKGSGQTVASLSSSNTYETDLAANIIALARHGGQL